MRSDLLPQFRQTVGRRVLVSAARCDRSNRSLFDLLWSVLIGEPLAEIDGT